MSKLFGRVGTSAMKYQFELSVTSLHMSIPLTTPMCVKWTRGPRTATNQPVPGKNGVYEWPSGPNAKPMQIVATMYFKKNKFQEKKSKLTVKQLLGKDLKSVGQVEIDLAEFCGEGELTKKLTLKLQKCSDKQAFLYCNIRSKWLKALQASDGADDTASQISGASSVDARSESNVNAHDVADINDLDGMEDAADDGGPDGAGGEDEEEDENGQATSASTNAATTNAAASPSTSSIHSLTLPSPSPAPVTPTPVASPPSNSNGSHATTVGAHPSIPAVSVSLPITAALTYSSASPAATNSATPTSFNAAVLTPNAILSPRTTRTSSSGHLAPVNLKQEQFLQSQAVEIEQLRYKLQDYNNAIQNERVASGKLAGVQAQVDQLQSTLNGFEKEKQESERILIAKSTQLQTQLAQLQRNYESLQKEKSDAESEHDKAILKLRTDLKNAQGELDKNHQEKTSLQRSFETQLVEQKVAAEKELHTRQLQQQQFEQQISEQKVVIEQLKSKLFHSETASASPPAQSPNAPSLQESFNKEKQELLDSFAKERATMTDNFTREKASLEKQVRELKGELDQASKIMEESFGRVTLLETKLSQLQEEHTKELDQQDQDIERLEAQLKEKDAAIAAVKTELSSKSASQTDSQLATSELEIELKSLQSSILTEIQRREALATKLEASERQVLELKTAQKKMELIQEAELKTVKTLWQQEKEKFIADTTAEREKLVKDLEEARSQLASSSATPNSPTTPSPSDSAEKDILIANLQKKLEDYSMRILGLEEERAKVEADLLTMESALQKQKEDELVLLEERYEENLKWKKSLREKENELEETIKTHRDSAKEMKDLKTALDKAQKEIKEKVRLLEVSEASLETMTVKVDKSKDELKKMKQLIDSSSQRIRELETNLTTTTEAKETLEKTLQQRSDDLERLTMKRHELETEWDKERAELSKKIETLEAENESFKDIHALSATSSLPAVPSPSTSLPTSSPEPSSDLIYTQTLLSKRNAELSELEAQMKDLKLKLRSLEDVEEQYTTLMTRSKETEASLTKKLTDLTREKVGVEEELALTKEKRERDRAKLQDKDEKERELRLSIAQLQNETSSHHSVLTSDLESRNKKIDELQDALILKQSKIAEQQDRLNSMTRQCETLSREHSSSKENLAIIQTKLEQATQSLNEATAKIESDKSAYQLALTKLQQQLDHLTKRRMIFDTIQGDALSALKKDKPTQALLESLQSKIQFYEDQLSDMDESMNMAKSSWMASTAVLVEQNEVAERLVAQLKKDLSDALESKGLDAAKLLSLETKLRKAEKDKSKLSELMSRFEVELTTKKVELAASLDQLSTQEYENEKLKAQLSKQLKLCDTHMAELNKARN